MKDVYFYVLVSITVVLHISAMYYTWVKSREIKNHNEPIDILHSLLGDYSDYHYTKNWYFIIFLLPYLLSYNLLTISIIKDIVIQVCVLIILRSFTLVTTLLPKKKNCNVEKLNIFDLIIGGFCYDKMYSGHTGTGMLLTLNAFRYGFITTKILNLVLFTIINVVNILLIAATRSHFTMDIIVGLYTSVFIFMLSLTN